MAYGDLASLFAPRSVAVLGASRSPAKISGRPLALMRSIGFGGRLYPINAVADEVQGLRAYARLADLPETPEAAILALPRAAVKDALEQCAGAGVRLAVVFSSGFREAGPEGAALEAECRAVARDVGMRLLGPNCMGAFDLHARTALTFAKAASRAGTTGGLSIASQSGAVASYLFTAAQARGIGVSKWVATGNEADVSVAECIAFMARDPSTEVIAAYIEGVQDGPALLDALREAARSDTPVVLLKAGRSEAGAAAAGTHTGALAGDDAVFDAAVRAGGAVRAESLEQLIDICALFAAGCRRSARLGLGSISGGAGIIMADAGAGTALQLPDLPPDTAHRIGSVLPDATPGNPLDTTASIIEDYSKLSEVLRAYEASGAFDVVALFLGTVGYSDTGTAAVIDAVAAADMRRVLPVLVLQADAANGSRYAERGLCTIPDPSRAVRALAAVATRRDPDIVDVPRPGSRVARPDAALNEAETKAMLARAGLAILDETLVRSPDEAARAVSDREGRFALKLVSPDIAHKSDIGGVVLDVADPEAARAAYSRIVSAAARAAPAARIDGVLVSPMIEPVAELIVGTVNDPTFGPAVMVGLGGIFAEIAKDTCLELAPVSPRTARTMIERLAGFALLTGARGRQPGDIDAAAEAVAALSAFAAANADWVRSVEVNPLAVMPRGAVALDALVVGAPGRDAQKGDPVR